MNPDPEQPAGFVAMGETWKQEWKPLALLLALFVVCFYLPVGVPRFDNAVAEGLELVKWYAREHVLLCLVPALFIAGGISVFVNQAAVLRYLGPNADTLAKLKARFPNIAITAENAQVVAQEIVFLAVHPPAVAEVAAGIKGALKSDAIVVSLAPKFTVAKLTGLLGGCARVARVIPNAPSIIGQGYNPIAFGPGLVGADKAVIAGLLAPLGDSPEVAEDKLEAYAVLSAMGPTYLWFQLQALREIAAGFGLTDTEITPALKRMVCGGTRALVESGLTPAEVMDLIPVKPLVEMEPHVSEVYRTKLTAIYQKIRP